MMKRLVTLLLLLLGPGLATAQRPGQVDPTELMKRLQDPAAMQRMAAQAEAAQKCMEGIDQAQLEALQKRAEAAAREIKRLCTEGKKAEALARGVSLSREMRSNAILRKMRECTRGISEMMKGMMPIRIPGMDDESDPTDRDICSQELAR